MWRILFPFLSFWFCAWFSMSLLLLHDASPWPLSDFSSRNAGWSLCQPTASHLKCPPCLSVFLPPLSGRKQAECPGIPLSSRVYLLVIKFSVFSFSEGHKVSPSIWVLYAQTGNLSCCSLNVSLKVHSWAPSSVCVRGVSTLRGQG